MIRARRVSQAYPVVLALGCLAGLGWLALRRGVSVQAELDSFWAACFALAAGLVGARLVFAALHGAYFLEHPLEVAWLWQGGLSWVGGAAGAAAAVGLYAGLRRLHLAPLADALTLPLLIVALSAWTGCLLESCVYGLPVAAGPFAPPSEDLFGVVKPRWPTAAVGMIACGLLLSAFTLLEGRPLSPGLRAALAVVGIAAIALGLSFTRADPTLEFGGFRIDSWGAAAVMALAGAAVWMTRRKRVVK
jgi:phosphatidylglycerol:prolipoprotein diacylglycerol transferase